MTYGLQIMDASGTLVWDSNTVLGGVPGDFREYSGATAGETVSYPQFAGLTAVLLDSGGVSRGITMDVSAGYPVITVASTGLYRSFTLMVY